MEGLQISLRVTAPDPDVAGTGVRQFGIWLDDATISPRKILKMWRARPAFVPAELRRARMACQP